MKFVLEIELGNKVMQTPADMKHVLRSVADDMDVIGTDEDGVWSIHHGAIRDDNGNRVGEWAVQE